LSSTSGFARNTWNVYDANTGRLAYTLHSTTSASVTAVTSFSYDDTRNTAKTVQFFAAYTVGSVTQGDLDFWATAQASNADNRVSRTVYDKDGRAAYVIDAGNYVISYDYDLDGRVIAEIRYASTYSVDDTVTESVLDTLTNLDTATGLHLSPPASAQKVAYVYDAAGRLVDSYDGENKRTHYVYDGMGRVVDRTVGHASDDASTTHYDYDAAGRVSKETTATGTTDPAMVTTYGYDGMGRLVDKTIGDSSASVSTHYTYDAGGHVSSEVVASGISDDVSTTTYSYNAFGQVVDKKVGAGTADESVTHYTYDNAGRLYTETLAWNDAVPRTVITTTVYQYNAFSELSDVTIAANAVYEYDDGELNVTIASGDNGLKSTTHYVYDNNGRVKSKTIAYGATDGHGTSEAATTSYTYDVFDETLTTQDGRGFTTSLAYDVLGNAVSVTTPIGTSGNNAVRTYAYDAFHNKIVETSPVDQYSPAATHNTYFFYDKRNLLILQIDQEGYATRYEYNARGELIKTTHYSTKVTGTIVPGTQPTITVDADNDEETNITRDLLGRVISVRDAEGTDADGDPVAGHQKDYTYNAIGQQLTFKNELGGVTTYAYTARGQLKSETRAMEARNADGTIADSSVKTTYSYDRRGNRTQMVEASNIVSQKRTTNYVYDKLNRLTATLHDTVEVIDPFTLTKTTNFTPTETLAYNARSEVIRATDAAGATTYFFYDHRGNKVAQVSPIGTLASAAGTFSSFTYDLNGNLTKQRVYGDAVALPPTLGSDGLPIATDPNNYRETIYAYDRSNRLTTTTVASLRTGAWGSTTYSTNTADVKITNTYDKNNNIIKQTDGAGNNVYFYYDKAGRKVAQIDQENYLTCYTLDANGNVTTEERFAKKLTATPTTSSVIFGSGGLRESVAGLGTELDRVTNFTYDKNGRRLTETRTGVVAWLLSSGVLIPASTDATIIYEYNGLGEVTRKAEATSTSENTWYTYDTFGRQTKVQGRTFTDYLTHTVQKTTTMAYDGLNDLVRSVQVGDGGSVNVDRVTRYTYTQGRLTTMTDATDFVTNYAYDKAGNLVLTSYDRVTSGGGSPLTEGKVVGYDAAGRVIFQSMASKSGTTWSFGTNDQTHMHYNAFGEMDKRGVNKDAASHDMWQETFDYDAGGRLWRSTSGDGTTRLYLYDANGKQTLMISSSGGSLPSGYVWKSPAIGETELNIQEAVSLLTNSGANTIGTVNVAGLILTFTGRDKRGMENYTGEPYRQLNDSATRYTITHSRTYNAFGEVVSETDANLNTTLFKYNTLGKLIERDDPAVSWTDENGTITTGYSAKHEYKYDLGGRLRGVVDANDNETARALLVNTGYGDEEGTVTKEYRPGSGAGTDGDYVYAYDVFGDLRQTTDELGKTEIYTYDKMGRLIEIDHQARGDGTQLKDKYTYDGLGQRLKHWNVQVQPTGSPITSPVETTDYDILGRVASVVDMGGYTTTYGYAWDAAIATGSLGTFGGWAKITTGPAQLTTTTKRSATEKTDYFGHLVDKTNYGGGHVTFTFDAAGRTTGDGVSSYTYYNTGLLASTYLTFTNWEVMSGHNQNVQYIVDSNYEYDWNGNRTHEDQYSRKIYTKYDTNDEPMEEPGIAPVWNQGADITYDAMNRMVSYRDTNPNSFSEADIDWEYDKNGNIRLIHSRYDQISDDGMSSTELNRSLWYKYDSRNRFVTTKGQLLNGSGAVIEYADHILGTTGTIGRSTTGTDITYNAAGQRSTATGADGTETYSYTEDGYLKQVKIGSTERGLYIRDAMGRIVEYDEYDSAHNLTYSRYNVVYNDNSQVTGDDVKVIRPDTAGGTNHTWITHTDYDYKADSNSDGDYTDTTDLYQGGNLTHTHSTVSKDDDNQPHSESDTSYSYGWWDGAQQSGVSYTPDWTNKTAVNTTTYTYDPAGHLFNIHIGDGMPRDVTFAVNALGEILSRKETGWNNTRPYEVHFYVNGIQVGDVSNNGTSDVDYATSIARHTALPAYGHGGVNAGQFAYKLGTDGVTYSGVGMGTAYADFDQSYDPINGLNYESTSSRYTVQDGDTLESIALQIWGDASFWYMLADANGLIGSETLIAGQDLIVPNKVHNSHNTNDVFKVYDPNKAVGDNFPSLPKPNHSNNCGVFGQILLVAIAVAVAILSKGALTKLAVAALTELGATPVVAGAVGAFAGVGIAGAAGSVVSQGVGLATGIQNSFSWRGVAESAIGAILAGPSTGDFLTDVVAGAVSNAEIQGVELATGLEKRFDWAGVAAGGIVNGVTGFARGEFSDWEPFGSYVWNDRVQAFASGTAGAIAGATARTLIKGTDFGDNLVAVLPDVVGATIGTIIGNDLAALSEPYPAHTKKGQSIGQPSERTSYPLHEVGSLHLKGAYFLPGEGTESFNGALNDTSPYGPAALALAESQSADNGPLETVVVTAPRYGDLVSNINVQLSINTNIRQSFESPLVASRQRMEAWKNSMANYWQGEGARESNLFAYAPPTGNPAIDIWNQAKAIENYPDALDTHPVSRLYVAGQLVSTAAAVAPVLKPLAELSLGFAETDAALEAMINATGAIGNDVVPVGSIGLTGIRAYQAAGAARQVLVDGELALQFPGASIQAERSLRTVDGVLAIDPLTGTGRRIDTVVIQDGQALASIETTSLNANKAAQIAKEMRIRQAGGTFVRDKVTGQLIDLSQVPTQIVRKP
jgi:YD repeat-containing protein